MAFLRRIEDHMAKAAFRRELARCNRARRCAVHLGRDLTQPAHGLDGLDRFQQSAQPGLHRRPDTLFVAADGEESLGPIRM